jgi:hypothetical protein
MKTHIPDSEDTIELTGSGAATCGASGPYFSSPASLFNSEPDDDWTMTEDGYFPSSVLVLCHQASVI